MSLVVLPRQNIPDINGKPRVGAKLYIYDVTSTNEHPAYSTSDLDVALTYPIVSEGNGFFPDVYVDPDDGDYKVVIKDSADVVIYTSDKLKPFDVGAIAIGQALYPITAAETACSVTIVYPYYPPGDARRYGILPNSSSYSTANTTALKQLASPEISATGFIGNLYFPPIIGSDTYHFDDLVTYRRHIDVDLCGCELKLTKAGSDSTAINGGFVYAVADFNLRNGTININWPDAPATQGHAICIGSRSAATQYFPNHYDSLLAYKQGNVTISNVRIISNAVNAKSMLMLGGLRNVQIENLDMQGTCGGIYYEFGWATYNVDSALRETSHAHNINFKNITAANLTSGSEDYAIWMVGAAGFSVDGLKVKGGYGSVKGSIGEAFFYRPWAGEDEGIVKRGVYIRGVKHLNGAGTSIDITGAQATGGSYLAATINALGHPADYDARTDLLDAVIEDCQIYNCAGYGITTSAGRIAVRNTFINKCQRGIVCTEDTTFMVLDNVATVNSTSYGMQIGNGTFQYNPAREKVITIRNCFVAGNGTAGTVAGIVLANTRSALIENCRFGYETAHDAVAETTQAQGVNAASTCSGVRIVGCYGGGTSGGANMYSLGSSGSDGRGCTIEKCGGVVTYNGLWGDGKTDLQVMTYGPSMTPNAQFNTDFTITATNATAFTINAPTNMRYGQVITLTIRNTSGGALGVATWNAVFKMAAWTQPGNGFSASITFRWDGTNWIEVARGGTTVPN